MAPAFIRRRPVHWLCAGGPDQDRLRPLLALCGRRHNVEGRSFRIHYFSPLSSSAAAPSAAPWIGGGPELGWPPARDNAAMAAWARPRSPAASSPPPLPPPSAPPPPSGISSTLACAAGAARGNHGESRASSKTAPPSPAHALEQLRRCRRHRANDREGALRRRSI